MELQKLLEVNRTYRRFFENEQVPVEVLRNLVGLAALTPSAANLQPLKFILSNTREKNRKIFSTLGWAGYLPDWPGPEPGERPPAYVVVLGDTGITGNWSADPGIVMQTILLGASENGLGGCIFGSVRRKELAGLLGIPPEYEILYVLALGRPKEKIVLEQIGEDGDIRYYRDENRIHHVPKRRVDELIVEI